MSADGFSGLRVGQAAGALAPLVADRTVYCNSSTGNDTTGDGSTGAPWQTLARAWADRLTYGELRAKYIVQLIGVGPYTMPVMASSVASEGGYFITLGDPASDVVNATGTFSGNFSTSTFLASTSAGLGADTHKGRFLYITSGNCSGVRSLILANTDTSITVPLLNWRTTLGAVANGDTFSIKTPGTVINVPTPSNGQEVPGFVNCTGAGYPSGSSTGRPPRHWIVGCSFTGATLRHKLSWVIMMGCSLSQQLQSIGGEIWLGGVLNAFPMGVGADTRTDLLTGYGCSTGSTFIVGGRAWAAIYGLYSTGSVIIGLASLGDYALFNGARLNGALSINGGRAEGNGSALHLINSTITVQRNGQLILNGGTWTFAVTSGSCLLASQGGLIVHDFATLSGGTSDAAGYGSQALSGGRIMFIGLTPTLTGGTASSDIKAENTAAVANSALNANHTSTTDTTTQAIVMRVAA